MTPEEIDRLEKAGFRLEYAEDGLWKIYPHKRKQKEMWGIMFKAKHPTAEHIKWDLGVDQFAYTYDAGVWLEPIPWQYGWGWQRIFGEPFVAVDVGAYYGESAIALLAHGASRVHAVEPNALAHFVLRKNAADGGYHKILPYRAWISDKNGVKPVAVPARGWGHPDEELQKDTKLITVYVPHETPDVLLRRIDSGAPMLLKIDCEGCEAHFLRAFAERKVAPPPAVVMEAHVRSSKDVVMFDTLIREAFSCSFSRARDCYYAVFLDPPRLVDATSTVVTTFAILRAPLVAQRLEDKLANVGYIWKGTPLWDGLDPTALWKTTFLDYAPIFRVHEFLQVFKEVVGEELRGETVNNRFFQNCNGGAAE